jgi:hypothetical protein
MQPLQVHQPLHNRRVMACRRWPATWRLPFHAEAASCICMRSVWRRHYVRFWDDVGKHAHEHSSHRMCDRMSGFITDLDNANDLHLSDGDDSYDGGGEAAGLGAFNDYGVDFGQNAPVHQVDEAPASLAVEQCNAVVMHVQTEVHVRRPDAVTMPSTCPLSPT